MTKEYGTFTYKEAELEVIAYFQRGISGDGYNVPDDPDFIQLVQIIYKGTMIEFLCEACEDIQLTSKTLEIMYDIFSYKTEVNTEFNVTQMFTKGPLDITELERQMLDDIYLNS